MNVIHMKKLAILLKILLLLERIRSERKGEVIRGWVRGKKRTELSRRLLGALIKHAILMI
jgi:hypothetical protein